MDDPNCLERDIAVIGMSIRFPLADTLCAFWNILKNGTDCIRPIPAKRKQQLEPYLKTLAKENREQNFCEAAYLDEIGMFDYKSFHITKREAELMDPNQRLFLTVVKDALDDAYFDYNQNNVGIYVGYLGTDEYYKILQTIDPQSISSALIGNCAPILSGRISRIFDFTGPNMLINTSCSSSLVAVHEACQALIHNRCKIAIAGGVSVHPIPLRSTWIGIESEDGRARPFDDSAQGTGCGEGVGAVILKPLGKALENRDRIYAVIKGGAVNHDGRAMTISSPNPAAQEKVLCAAWENAGINPCDIGYIEAHGTGTTLGDPIEIQGIRNAFRHYTNADAFCAVGAVKSNIGHLDGAAGIAGLIKAILQLQYKSIVPTVHFKQLNRNIDPNHLPVYISSKLHPFPGRSGRRICGVSSFGISGTNCHIVIEAFEPKEHERITEKRRQTSVMKNEAELCWLQPPSSWQDRNHDPEPETASQLCRILECLFNIEKITPYQDFIQIGGDSLLALEFINEIYRHIHVSVTVSEILNHTIIQDLAAYIDAKRKDSPPSNIALKNKSRFPLTYMQKGIYTQHCLQGKSSLNNISSAFLIQGPLDISRLNHAFQEAVNHNQSLRCSFQIEKNNVFQAVKPSVPFQIHIVDSANKLDLNSLSQYIQPFDLTAPPLLKVYLIQITRNLHILITDIHHIISDGISNACLIQEVIACYKNEATQEKTVDYADYVDWHYQYINNQSRLIHETRYYKSLLDHPGVIEYSNQKTQSNRPNGHETIEFTLPAEIYDQLTEAASYLHITEFSLLLSVFFLLIYNLTRHEDLTIGTVASGRLAAEHQHVLGLFVNLLAIRMNIGANQPIGAFMQDVCKTIKSAMDMQCYPYELLIKDLQYDIQPNGQTLFNTVFVMQNYKQTSLDIEHLHISRIPLNPQQSKYDLYVNCYKEGQALLFSWTYAIKIFDRNQMTRLWKSFCSFIIEGIRAYDIPISKFLKKSAGNS